MPQEVNRRRFLVVAKTYPELSSKYGETVCTAAIDESGKPLRIYPIPFRYLMGKQRFKRYQWVSAVLHKSKNDNRPESYRVEANSIELRDEIPATSDEWGLRSEVVMRGQDWQFSSMGDLLEAQKEAGCSLGFVRPKTITGVTTSERESADAQSFDQKLKLLRAKNAAARKQLNLFERTVPQRMKHLEFLAGRVCIEWLCHDEQCTGHSMQVLDWEICQLARKEGLQKARNKVAELLDLDRYRTAFILGNFHMYPGSFAIIGLWYPLRANRVF